MSSLLQHLERHRKQQHHHQLLDKAKKAQSASTTTTPVPRAPEDAVFVKDELQSVVDAWMQASSKNSAHAPQHAVDIFANAVDPRAGLGASYVSKRRVVSDSEAGKAMEASVNRIKRRAAREEDDAAADARFDALVHKEKRHRSVVNDAGEQDDEDSERGRSESFGGAKSRKSNSSGGAVHHKLLDKKRKKSKKKNKSKS